MAGGLANEDVTPEELLPPAALTATRNDAGSGDQTQSTDPFVATNEAEAGCRRSHKSQ